MRYWMICTNPLYQVINLILKPIKPVNTQYDENNTCRYYFATTVHGIHF